MIYGFIIAFSFYISPQAVLTETQLVKAKIPPAQITSVINQSDLDQDKQLKMFTEAKPGHLEQYTTHWIYRQLEGIKLKGIGFVGGVGGGGHPVKGLGNFELVLM